MTVNRLLYSPIARLTLCAILLLISPLLPIAIVAYASFALAVASLRLSLRRQDAYVLVSGMVLLQATWVALIFLVYTYKLSPLAVTDIRANVLEVDVLALTLLSGSQFLFILSSLQSPNGTSADRLHQFGGGAILKWLSYFVMVATSLIINQSATIIQGGYQGNQAGYWGGLPLIFVLSSGAWILLQRRHNIQYLILLNIVIGWWLLNGNRSEVLVQFIFGNYLFLKQMLARSRNTPLVTLAFTFSVIAAFILFTFIGHVRHYGFGGDAFSVTSAVGNIVRDERISFQTFGSSIYSVAVAIFAAENTGILYGQTFLGQLMNTIPSFIPTPWERFPDASRHLVDYQILGGLGLVGEGYLNFGIVGPAIVGAAFTLITSAAMKRSGKSFLASWFLITLAFYSPRFLLYGYVYLYNVLVFFSGAVVLRAALRQSPLVAPKAVAPRLAE